MSKRIFFLFLLGLSFGKLYAWQPNDKFYRFAIRTDAFRLLYKTELDLECRFNGKYSVGLSSSVYYNANLIFDDAISAYRFDPYCRFYFLKSKKLYWQLKINCTNYKAIHVEEYEEEIYNNSTATTQWTYSRSETFRNYVTGGAGIAVGYQIFLDKKKHLLLEFQLEVQYIPYPVASGNTTHLYKEVDSFGNVYVNNTTTSSTRTKGNRDLFWYFSGPGAVLNPKIKIGYCF